MIRVRLLLMGWYGAPFAFKITDEGKMVGCILAGNIKQDNGYNEWLDAMMPTFNGQQNEEALALRDYFGKTSSKVYRHTLITVLRKLPSSRVMNGRPTPTIT